MAKTNSVKVATLAADQWLKRLHKGLSKNPHAENSLAMYSSICDGITTDPCLMFVPVEDHIVHRGDGVFEAIKISAGHAYRLQAHLDRLHISAGKIGLKIPVSDRKLTGLIRETATAAKKKDPSLENALIRLFISRGPGGFGTNPYDSMGPQVYIVVTRLKPPSEEKYHHGVSVGISKIPVKEGFFANVKSCNYLPNVLMKKEAVDAKLDFTVSFDEDGFLAEGSTENCAVIDKDGYLVAPKYSRILKGVTLQRCLELAPELVKLKVLKGVRQKNLSLTELLQAKEMAMIGTTLDVLPVAKFATKTYRPSHTAESAFILLLEKLRQDLQSGPERVKMW